MWSIWQRKASTKVEDEQHARVLEAHEKAMVEDASVRSADQQAVDRFVHIAGPLLSQMGVGGVTGFAAGYAAKKVGKVAAVTVGIGFMLVQTAAYKGYLDVHWRTISKDLSLALDENNDGKLDEKDAEILFRKAIDIGKFNLPSSTGFVAGLMLGLSKG